MKTAIVILSLVILAMGFLLLSKHSTSEWAGVDESVVEKFAKQANREAHAPLMDIGKGDLALFAFLIAGAVGGFCAGYFFRELFPPKPKGTEASKPDV